MTSLVAEARSCRICGRPLISASYGRSRFCECSACGYAELVAAGVRRDYWSDSSQSHPEERYWRAAKQAYFDSALDLLGTLANGRRLLDVGGGVGFFVERALQRGWDGYSLDVSETVTAVAASRLGSDRALSSLTSLEPRSFDAVTLWCVVAHTREPEKVLRDAALALAPGGHLWLTTPNFRYQRHYASARSLMRRPLDFATDDHIVHFTPDAIAALLRQEGFSSIRFHFRGISEACVAADSYSRPLVAAKRLWNRLAFAASEAGLPNLMSELQVTACLR
jgi:2-polyprenyl-3-methyl-5-hydroxy-6-metoxy-1,4-benzoquinol methylase